MKSLRYLGTQITTTIFRNHKFPSKICLRVQPILQPLYKLLHNEAEFKWTKEHQQIFEKMKQTITKQ